MLTDILEQVLFPFVEKPARYIGGELGVRVKDPHGRVNIVLAYPDLYEVGMSYTGGQILYHVFNEIPEALCERVYAPAGDAEALMREHGIPLFSLETHRPVAEFDVFGFTLAYEMVYTNMLGMLDLAGLPLLARDRGDEHPLVAAGGPICYNPEPVAAFIDFFFIGEVEETVPTLVETIAATRGRSRRERLEALSRLPSIYVPALRDAETGQPLVEGLPDKISAAHVAALKSEYYPQRPLMPLTEIAHDRVAVEIMRGCPQGCHFCQAGKIYKPVRVRSSQDIKTQIMENLKATGYDEVGLLSLSTTDYPGIQDLTVALTGDLDKKRVSLSFPSLRPASFTPKIAEAAARGHKSGLTFAPEVGSERMRQVVNKNIREDDLLNACRIAFDKGWLLVKLYFMIGLPTETDEDLNGIIDMVMNVVSLGREYRGQRRINVAISPFSPKAHTPFQWDEICPPEEILRKQDFLRRNLRAREVTLKFRDPHLSHLEGIIGRGDRRMADVILTAYRNGARFDGWSEHFNSDTWYAAFEENGIAITDYTRAHSFSETLPWDFIDRGQSKERLLQERSKSSQLARDPVTPAPAKAPPVTDNENMFGRRKRKIAAPASALAPTRGKIRLKWGKRGLVRFLSHLENNRIFERAIRRAELPVIYSQGFHPHQKLSFGPPLPLGYSSDGEYLDIQIEGTCTKEHLEALAATLPDGFFIVDYKLIYSKAPAISAVLNRATYTVTGDFGDTAALRSHLDRLLGLDSIIALRSTKDGGKRVEIRPAIFRLELSENGSAPAIDMELGLGQDGYAKPSEVLTVLELFDSKQLASFHIHRAGLQYRDEYGAYVDPLTAII